MCYIRYYNTPANCCGVTAVSIIFCISLLFFPTPESGSVKPVSPSRRNLEAYHGIYSLKSYSSRIDQSRTTEVPELATVAHKVPPGD